MKVRQLIVVVLLVSLALIPVLPLPRATAASDYSEKLSVYIAGSDALWSVRLNNLAVNSSSLLAAEKGLSVSWYNITILDTQDWQSDFQIFGPAGYNLLGLPFVPGQGMFLTVGATDYGSAAASLKVFDTYLSGAFYSVVNGSGSFTFFSPASYGEIATGTLLSLIPSGNGTGFASLVAAESFDTTASPMVTLSGTMNSTGYAHDLILSSISSTAILSTGQPNILGYYGTTASDITADNKSASSVIQVTTLDTPLVTTDTAATLSTNPSGLGDTYDLSLKPGQVVYSLNATVDTQNVLLVATRQVEGAVLKPGQNLTVTISLEGYSNSSEITGVKVRDDWWKSYSFFTLVSGKSNANVSSLSNRVPTFETYQLRYTGNESEQLQIPSSVVSYNYLVGTVNFTGYARLNPISLSLQADEPVLEAYVAPYQSYGVSVGGTQKVQVTVTNVGTGDITSYSVGGKQESGLPVNQSQSFVFPITAPGLLQNNVSVSYSVKYNGTSGQSFTAQTNALTLLFRHTSMVVAFPQLTVNSTVSDLSSGENLTLTARIANEGLGNLTSFSASTPLPQGLTCGKTTGNLTCSNGQLTIAYKFLKNQATFSSTIKFNVTSSENVVITPFTFTYTTSGYTLSGTSSAIAAPTGLVLKKSFSPDSGFSGMTAKASITATNEGPFGIFNATINTAQDSFGTLTGSGNAQQTFNRTLFPGGALSFSYSLNLLSNYGSQSDTPVTASFFFAGTQFDTSSTKSNVTVYQPLTSSITSSPSSPTEGKSFQITFEITNPSSANVTNVVMSLPVPTGVSISGLTGASYSNKLITVDLAQLQAGSSSTASVTAETSSGISIPFSGSKLTFSYAGQTIAGTTPTTGITIGEDVLTRYVIPIAIAFVALLATLVYVKRKLAVTAPASPK